MTTAENLQPGTVNACNFGCPVIISSPEQAGMNPTGDRVFNTAVSPLGAEVLPLQGRKDLSDGQNGLVSLSSVLRRNFLEGLIGKYTKVKSILSGKKEIIIPPVLDDTERDQLQAILTGRDTFEREYPLVDDLQPRGRRFPLRHLLAALGLVALAWLLRDSPFIRHYQTVDQSAITTEFVPDLSPDAALGGYIPAGSDNLPEPTKTLTPFENFINSKVIVQPGDSVSNLVRKAQN